jgi:NADH-quinone oxidoreductase subunit J
VTAVFYISSAVALAATVMVITRLNAAHAALYLIVSLLSMAVIFFALGAPFAAALEIIVYAGAIMVLFIFVIMMLNLGPMAARQETKLLSPRTWLGPSILVLILAAEMAYVLLGGRSVPVVAEQQGAKEIAVSLFGPYMLGVELASFLLLAGLVGAYHLGFSPGPDEGEGP